MKCKVLDTEATSSKRMSGWAHNPTGVRAKVGPTGSGKSDKTQKGCTGFYVKRNFLMCQSMELGARRAGCSRKTALEFNGV